MKLVPACAITEALHARCVKPSAARSPLKSRRRFPLVLPSAKARTRRTAMTLPAVTGRAGPHLLCAASAREQSPDLLGQGLAGRERRFLDNPAGIGDTNQRSVVSSARSPEGPGCSPGLRISSAPNRYPQITARAKLPAQAR
jgi:hypothetical protein